MSRRSPTPLPGVGLLDPVPGEDVTGTLTFNASRWLAQVNGAAAVDATITGPAASGGRGTIIGATRDPPKRQPRPGQPRGLLPSTPPGRLKRHFPDIPRRGSDEHYRD